VPTLLAAVPFAVCLLVLAACETTEPGPAVTFHAVWAGDPWLGEAWGVVIGQEADTLWITGSRPVGATQFGSGPIPESIVAVGVAFDGPGTYEFGEGAASFRYLIGGDVVSSVYAGTAGTLIIESISTAQVTGSVSFDAVHASGGQAAGPEARFQGTFSAQRLQPPTPLQTLGASAVARRR
jgi:hypothetical protein